MANENQTVGITDFDWDALQSGGYKSSEREALAVKYDETLSKMAEKEVVKAVVTSISKREVVVNLGYKSEGVVGANEFRYNPDLKVGDEVDVFVELQEDKNGQLVVSHKTARNHNAWERINEALESGEIITGHVESRTKGGLIVDVFGIEAFLPGSQIDV